MFKDESLPYIYIKTMGFSQFDRPIFEKYRLTKEEDPVAAQEPRTAVPEPGVGNSISNAEIEEIKGKLAALEETVRALKEEHENE